MLRIPLALSFISIAAGWNLSHAQVDGNGIILDYHTRIAVKNKKLITEKSVTIQINNKEGDWLSDIQIPYQRGDKITEAVILGMDNQVLRKLRKNEITVRNKLTSGTFYSDDLVKEFKLKWHQYPYRIRYSYEEDVEQYLSIISWSPILYYSIPVLNASLDVEIPKSIEIFIKNEGEYHYSKKDTLGLVHHHWKGNYLEQLKKEAFGLPRRDRIKPVKIVPKHFTYYYPGSQDSWLSFGNWVYEINRDLLTLTPEEQKKVDQIINGETDQRVIIDKLYRHLQEHIRYVNVSIDVGGMVPYPASYVCENKYGDCKALTIYMMALLKHAGIESFYTLVRAGENEDEIDVDFPGQQFNHVILAAPIEGDTVWLENTVNYLPSGYLGSFTQNRYGLLVNKDNSALVKIPPLELEKCVDQSIYNYKINENGAGSLALTRRMFGPESEDLSYVNTEINKEDQKKIINSVFEIKNSTLENIGINQFANGEMGFSVNLEYTLTNQIRELASSKIISFRPIYEASLQPADKREGDIKVTIPVNKTDSIIYDLPFLGNYEIDLPSDFTLSSDFGNYSANYKLSDNQVIVFRRFQLYAGNYPKEQYPDFYAFFKQVQTNNKRSKIILTPK